MFQQYNSKNSYKNVYPHGNEIYLMLMWQIYSVSWYAHEILEEKSLIHKRDHLNHKNMVLLAIFIYPRKSNSLSSRQLQREKILLCFGIELI